MAKKLIQRATFVSEIDWDEEWGPMPSPEELEEEIREDPFEFIESSRTTLTNFSVEVNE